MKPTDTANQITMGIAGFLFLQGLAAFATVLFASVTAQGEYRTIPPLFLAHLPAVFVGPALACRNKQVWRIGIAALGALIAFDVFTIWQKFGVSQFLTITASALLALEVASLLALLHPKIRKLFLG